ncbi:unnamed protein product [Amoebophrya sp. A120]|nr:unnamed protein product [Amoebophrya sp. A120]|eukprot:GSA120T00011887001.1
MASLFRRVLAAAGAGISLHLRRELLFSAVLLGGRGAFETSGMNASHSTRPFVVAVQVRPSWKPSLWRPSRLWLFPGGGPSPLTCMIDSKDLAGAKENFYEMLQHERPRLPTEYEYTELRDALFKIGDRTGAQNLFDAVQNEGEEFRNRKAWESPKSGKPEAQGGASPKPCREQLAEPSVFTPGNAGAVGRSAPRADGDPQGKAGWKGQEESMLAQQMQSGEWYIGCGRPEPGTRVGKSLLANLHSSNVEEGSEVRVSRPGDLICTTVHVFDPQGQSRKVLSNKLAQYCVLEGEECVFHSERATRETRNALIHILEMHEKEAYLMLLNAYSETGDAVGARQVLEDMKAAKIEPDARTYNSLLDAYGRRGDWEGVTDVLQQMKAAKIAQNVATCNIFVAAYIKGGDMDSARLVLEEMKDAGPAPNVITYHTLVSGHADAGDVEGVKGVLEEMRAAGIVPNAATYDALMNKAHIEKYKRDCSVAREGIEQVLPGRGETSAKGKKKRGNSVELIPKAGDVHAAWGQPPVRSQSTPLGRQRQRKPSGPPSARAAAGESERRSSRGHRSRTAVSSVPPASKTGADHPEQNDIRREKVSRFRGATPRRGRGRGRGQGRRSPSRPVPKRPAAASVFVDASSAAGAGPGGSNSTNGAAGVVEGIHDPAVGFFWDKQQNQEPWHHDTQPWPQPPQWMTNDNYTGPPAFYGCQGFQNCMVSATAGDHHDYWNPRDGTRTLGHFVWDGYNRGLEGAAQQQLVQAGEPVGGPHYVPQEQLMENLLTILTTDLPPKKREWKSHFDVPLLTGALCEYSRQECADSEDCDVTKATAQMEGSDEQLHT